MFAGASVVHAYYSPDLTIPTTPVPKPEAVARIALVKPRGHRASTTLRDGGIEGRMGTWADPVQLPTVTPSRPLFTQ